MPLEVSNIGFEQVEKVAAAGWLYAILDATDEPAVPEKVRQLDERRAASLFRGTAQEPYWACAPYLVKTDSAMLAWIFDALLQRPWGVFVVSQAELDVLRFHLQQFISVELPNGRSAHFRFYDPRVLAVYLPTCNQHELRAFFGPVRAYLVPTADKVTLLKNIDSGAPNGAAGPLPIRPEQFAVLGRLSLGDFIRRMTPHLHRLFADKCRAIGDPGISKAVEIGVASAAKYGIVDGPDVCRSIDLMFVFGVHFDSDTRFPWAATLLNNHSIVSSHQKLAAVVAAANEAERYRR